ncbi:telomere length regulation protein-domain-containing protein [Spinellus fusiger]|nr:telomere length regulation protein-domain-containing protein [Spinellus fusiger]
MPHQTNLETVLAELDTLDTEIKKTSNSNLKVIVQSLKTPLEWLDLSQDAVCTLPAGQHSQLIHDAAWKKHIWIVCQHIIPQWAFLLEPSSVYRPLLITTFMGNSDCEPSICLAMALTSLPVVLECLSIENNVSISALEVYAQLLKHFISSKLLYIYMSTDYTTPSLLMKRESLCSHLCSISARLGNTFGIDYHISDSIEKEWYLDKHFYPTLSRHLIQTIIALEENKVPRFYIGFAADLLAKMIRQGYAEICIKAMYPPVLTHVKQSKNQQAYSLWPSLWDKSECMSTVHGVSKAMLYYLKNRLVEADKNTSNDPSLIQSLAFDMAAVYFGSSNDSAESMKRMKAFVHYSILDLASERWADVRVLRLTLAAVVYAAGVGTDKEPCLSERALSVLCYAFETAANRWKESVFIEHSSEKEREYISSALLIVTSYLDKETLKESVAKTFLMGGISHYFSSADIRIAKLGVTVAEGVSECMDDPESRFVCGILDKETDHHFFQIKSLITAKDAICQLEEREIDLDTRAAEEEIEDEEPEDAKEMDPDARMEAESDSDLEPYLMEEESDEEGHKEKLKPPAYMLDLIGYLGDHDDPVKLDIGLSAAEAMIRQKTGLGSEIAENSIQVASLLIRLPETYQLTDFRKRQQGALVALIAAAPETLTSYIIDQIYDRNTSNGQKQALLISVSLAARELAGWTQDGSPQTLDTPYIENTQYPIDTHKMIKPIGKVRVFSHSSEIEQKRKRSTKSNKLNGLAHTTFFSPLLLGWWEGVQRKPRWWVGNDKMLMERFIMALNVIMDSATNTLDKRQIVADYFEFCSSLRHINSTQGVKRALLLGLDIIINTSYRQQESILVDLFPRQLAETQGWLQNILDNSNEDALKEQAIRLLTSIMTLSLKLDKIQ